MARKAELVSSEELNELDLLLMNPYELAMWVGGHVVGRDAMAVVRWLERRRPGVSAAFKSRYLLDSAELRARYLLSL